MRYNLNEFMLLCMHYFEFGQKSAFNIVQNSWFEKHEEENEQCGVRFHSRFSFYAIKRFNRGNWLWWTWMTINSVFYSFSDSKWSTIEVLFIFSEKRCELNFAFRKIQIKAKTKENYRYFEIGLEFTDFINICSVQKCSIDLRFRHFQDFFSFFNFKVLNCVLFWVFEATA